MIIVSKLDNAPNAFCLAVEEIEAWLLGDAQAVRMAYPQAKKSVLASYAPDSICGTWEVLADAIFPKKAAGLKKLGFAEVGRMKGEWANNIAPMLNIDRNGSASFHHFVNKVLSLVI